jgi:hypothetical protein
MGLPREVSQHTRVRTLVRTGMWRAVSQQACIQITILHMPAASLSGHSTQPEIMLEQ